jgi:proteasome-associated ATPase
MYGYSRAPDLERRLRIAEEEVERLRQHIEQMQNQGTRTISTVIAWDPTRRAARAVLNNYIVEVSVAPQFADRVHVGAALELTSDSKIVNVTTPNMAGGIATVLEIISTTHIEVQFGNDVRAVAVAPMDKAPVIGDRGLLDPQGYVFIKNFGRKDTAHVLGHDTLVSFDDIGGQEEAKQAIREALIDPHEKREQYKRFNMTPSKGLLLCGPPGTGKTMLAKAAATALARLHGKNVMSSGFHYVKGPELLNKLLGETEANIRRLFAAAREHHERHHYPAVIFCDECDALLGRRGSMSPGVETVVRTVVPMFLAEMDGIHQSTVFVLLATNRPDILDPAVVRDGRISRKVHVPRPSEAAALDIFTKLFAKRPSAKGLAEHAVEVLFSEERHLWDVTTDKKTVVPIYLKTLVSGAMIAGIVDRAAQLAIRANADKIVSKHVDLAIDDVDKEQRRLTHDLSDFTDALDGMIVSVDKARPGTKEAPKP